jgi:biopolymer transport protein ExbB/TolQ
MSVNELAKFLGDACYGFLALNFLWGLYCVILIWRRIVQLRFRSAEAESAFVTELQGFLKARDFDGAAQFCDYDFRALPRLCLLMLANRGLDYHKLRQLVSSALQRTILADLEYRLSWIVTVIKSGPLLGLFGTVLGMMAAFGRIGTGEKIQPSQIADEISIALICTAMGLGTAIPLGYILAGLSIRVRLLQESLEASLAILLDDFRTRDPAGGQR